jgi:solute carrier family 6 amino acid transporter-like protein 5/7/9/14
MSPIFKGLGFGMIGATFYVAIYYNMIIAWSIFYMFAGFQAELPWIHCPNNITDIVNKCYEPNVTQLAPGIHLNSTWSPSEEYFNTIMLGLDQQANNWGNFGTVRWQLVLCLLAAWVIVCLCLIKGVQSSGKVVYFTALFPFFVLFILFVVGLTLPGSGAGIMFYITPDFEKLKTVDVWTSAANQIFYSLGPAFGGLITLSSYNKFNNNCHRDAILIAFSNCATSVFAGFVVFSILGFMAHTQDVPVADVVKDGTGLAFVAFPDAFSRMSFCPQLWAFLFFFMLLTLGLDSMFATVETMTTAILDHFRSLRPFKEWVVASTCAFCFICGLSMCSQGGIYMFKLLDDRSASWNILLFALLEVILVAWVYGVDLFFENLKEMEIPMPWVMKWYWKICWKFISPTILTVLIIMGLAQSGPVKYSNYEFETPVQALGWMLGVSTVIFIPLVGAWNVYKRYRAHKPVGWALLKPTPKWKPANGQPTGTSMDKLDEA